MSGDTLDCSALLAAGIHDLKNSIGLLQLQTQALQDRLHEPELLPIQAELGRLRQQLVEMMALYRLQQGSYRLAATETFVDDLLEEAYLRNQHRLQCAGRQLRWRSEPDLSWFLDRQLVGAVLDNLIHNGLRHADGELLLRARTQCVEGRLWLSLSVEDQGPGFPAERLGEARAEAGDLDWQRGATGFGLYFCVLAARQHRQDHQSGRVVLSNRDEGGGRVELLLP